MKWIVVFSAMLACQPAWAAPKEELADTRQLLVSMAGNGKASCELWRSVAARMKDDADFRRKVEAREKGLPDPAPSAAPERMARISESCGHPKKEPKPTAK